MLDIILILKENDLTYQRLGVTIIDRGESFYQPLMPLVVEDMENKGKTLSSLRIIAYLLTGYHLLLTMET